jgi:CRISPR associated protein Cas2
MSVLIVTYDLHGPVRTYQSLFDYLGTFPSERVVESTWVISAGYKTAEQVRNEIANHVHHDDSVLVIDVGRTAAWQGLPDRVGAWLKRYMTAAA